ncbi:MAG: META domain-containing protein [Beijerinckiaceae bacterium]
MMSIRAILWAAALAAAGGFTSAAYASPPALRGSEWRVISLSGGGLPADAGVTVAFHAENRVTGRSGCNSYFATAESLGGRIAFGAVGSTRRACPPPQMALETRFLQILRSVDRWDMRNGRLTLMAPDGRRIVAVR